MLFLFAFIAVCNVLYKLNPIISPMPAVKSPSPMSERTVNFSFIISHEKNIVSSYLYIRQIRSRNDIEQSPCFWL